MTNVASTLRRSAALAPDSIAIRYAARSMTYAELDDATRRFAGALEGLGLRRGDRVAVFAKNAPEYVVAMYGAFAAGMIVVPVNAKLSEAEVAVILADSGAALLVHDRSSIASDGIPQLRIGDDFHALLASATALPQPVEVAADDVAWLFYTSGTTGMPKGAELTHRNLLAMTWLELLDVCDYRSDDRVLHVAPLSHGSGLYLLGSIARGAENRIYAERSFDPADVLRLIERERITVLAFVAPTMIVMLLDADVHADTSSLRRVVYGGAPIHLEHARRMVERFGDVFVQIYGQGESPMTITYLDLAGGPADDETLQSAGFAHPGIDVAVFDEDDRPVPPGEPGEICVRGDTVMRGYRNNPDATAAALRNGWLHTGDIGRLDEHGRLTLLDRSKDVVISGGTNIYPREVEDAILAHPGVEDVVVFGEPDPLWGESVTAVVVRAVDHEVTETEVIDWCRTQIASFKKPKRVVFLEALPVNAYGKVLRRDLKLQLAQTTV